MVTFHLGTRSTSRVAITVEHTVTDVQECVTAIVHLTPDTLFSRGIACTTISQTNTAPRGIQ